MAEITVGSSVTIKTPDGKEIDGVVDRIVPEYKDISTTPADWRYYQRCSDAFEEKLSEVPPRNAVTYAVINVEGKKPNRSMTLNWTMTPAICIDEALISELTRGLSNVLEYKDNMSLKIPFIVGATALYELANLLGMEWSRGIVRKGYPLQKISFCPKGTSTLHASTSN